MSTETKKWYQGTGFYIAAIMSVFGFFIGLQEQDVSGLVQYAFGIVGAGLAVRQKIKKAGIDLKAWITNPNTMAYLGTAVVAIVPKIPIEIFDKLNEVIVALFNKNYSALIAGVFNIATIAYFAIKGAGSKASA